MRYGSTLPLLVSALRRVEEETGYMRWRKGDTDLAAA